MFRPQCHYLSATLAGLVVFWLGTATARAQDDDFSFFVEMNLYSALALLLLVYFIFPIVAAWLGSKVVYQHNRFGLSVYYVLATYAFGAVMIFLFYVLHESPWFNMRFKGFSYLAIAFASLVGYFFIPLTVYHGTTLRTVAFFIVQAVISVGVFIVGLGLVVGGVGIYAWSSGQTLEEWRAAPPERNLAYEKSGVVFGVEVMANLRAILYPEEAAEWKQRQLAQVREQYDTLSQEKIVIPPEPVKEIDWSAVRFPGDPEPGEETAATAADPEPATPEPPPEEPPAKAPSAPPKPPVTASFTPGAVVLMDREVAFRTMGHELLVPVGAKVTLVRKVGADKWLVSYRREQFAVPQADLKLPSE